MTPSLPYPNITFVPLDVLTAEELNQMAANTDAIASVFPIKSANIASNAVTTAKIDAGAVTGAKIASAAVGTGKIDWSSMPNQDSSTVSYLTLGNVTFAWGYTIVNLNGTTAGSFGVNSVNLPVSFTNTSRCGVAITPEDPGSTNSLKVAAKFDSGSILVITIGTGAAPNSSRIATRFMVVGRTS